MAVDIQGFDIVFSAANANHARTIDQSIASMGKNMGSLKQSSAEFAGIMERLGRLDISKLANDMAAIKNAVNGIDKDRLKQVFAAGTSETQNMLANITGVINKLAQAGGIKIAPVVNPVVASASNSQTSNATQSKDEALSEGKINSLWTERARLMFQVETLWKKSVSLQKEGKDLSQAEGELLLQKYQRLQGVINQLEKQKRINTDVYAKTENSGLIKVKQAEVNLEKWVTSEKEKAERRKTAIQKEEERKRQQSLRESQREYSRQAEMWRAANNNKNTTLTGAVDFAGTANTLNRLVTAQKYLKAALASTKPNTPEWQRAADTYKQVTQRINEIKKSMDGVKQQTNSIIPSLQNLAMQFGLVFSVQQLNQWIKHMVDVRAQFELQQIALRSIIQDKQKADEIFMQVQQMALKSPFSIMELNRFTKQMAAYGVEADKLVGTTKRLADVSAGLGVDMGRLILAYGQVKTANYLRATEVRQFTEAGLNITQELANYFTELNGKMVTAGEVTEMITKRMVKFEDVAEVFKRVTSAGGMFYNMQEKQSEGLKGQIQRIGDAYSIMLNDIGKSNQGVIAKILATIRILIQNWRTITPVIEATVGAFAAFYTIKGILGLVPILKSVCAGFALITAEMRAATGAMATLRAGFVATNTLIGTMGWIGLASAIGAAVFAMTQASNSVSQLEEDLDRMRREIIVDVADSVGRFKELADVIKDPTASFEDQTNALDELHRAYGDILPSELLEIENIRKMSGEYTQATEAIREYYRTKLQEEQKGRIEADAAAMFSSASRDVVEEATKELEKFGASKSTVQKIMNSIIEQAKTGAIKGAKEIGTAFTNALGKYYNTSIEIDESAFELIAGAVTAYQNELASLDTTVIEYKSHEEELEHQAMQETAKNFEEQRKKVEALTNALKKLYNLRVEQERIVAQGGTLDNSDNIRKATAIETVNNAYAELGDTTKRTDAQIMGLVQSTYNLDAEIARVTHSIYGSFIKGLSDTKAKANDLANNKYLQTWIQGLQREIDAVDGTPVQKEIRKIEKSLSELYNVDLGTFDWLKTDIKTSFSSAAKEVKGKIDEIKEQVLQFKTIAGMSIFLDPTKHAEEVTGMTKEEYDRASKTIEMYTKLWNALGGHDKDNKTKRAGKTKGADKTEQTLRERIKLIKEANQTFEKYAKEYDKVIAKEKTYNDLMDRAKELNIADILRKDDLTNTATLDAMQNVYDKFKSLFEKKKYVGAKRDALKEMSDMKFEIAVELNENNRKKLQDSFDKMFGDYQLFIELDKIGINQNLAKDMFDIDYTSLDEIGARWKQLFLDKINDEYKQMDASFAGFKTYEEAKAKLSQEESNKNYEMAVNTEKKISEAFNKELESRMKEYAKYLKKSYSDSVNEQVNTYRQLRQLQMDADFKRNAIIGNDKLDDKQKQTALQELDAMSSQIATKMQEELQKKLNKIQWESFKDSPLFETVLSDIEHLSTGTIDMLIKKMEDLKKTYNGLDPKIIKELTKYTEQLTNQKIKNNPFKEWANALSEIHDLKKQGLTLDKLNENLVSDSDELTRLNAQIESYNKVLAIKQQMTHVTEQDVKLMQTDTQTLERQLRVLEEQKSKKSVVGVGADGSDESKSLDLQINKIQEILAARRTILASNRDNIVLSSQELALLQQESKEITKQINSLSKDKGDKEKDIKNINAQIGSWKKLSEAQKGAVAILNEVGSAASAGFSVAEAAINSFGGSSDEVTKAMLQGFDDCLQACLSLTTSIIAMGEAANAASGIIGIIAASLTAVATLFKTIFNVHEAKLEKSIKEHQRQLKKLEAEYDNLSDAISNAFSGFQLGTNTQAAIQNLERQNEQYRAMIENEKDKKDSDEDQIADWQQTIKDNLKKAQELRQQYFNELGGLGTGSDVRDAAEGFVDAWADAFGETSDGISGLKKQFNDFMKNIVKKQAYMKIADHWINKFGDMINASFDKYGQVNYEKLQTAMKWFTEEAMPQMDNALEDMNAFWERMGINLTGTTSNLSGLAAGIQGVTEETAQILEALLNSMRFYVADTNEQLKSILNTMNGANEENPFLKELKNQTKYLASIDKRLDSVISATKRASGSHINVFTT